MQFEKTKLDGVVIITPDVFGDNRGFFMESWSQKKMEEVGLFYNFVQDNHSLSTVKGTLRGIHFQKGDKAQAKLVRCVRGAVLDVAVDLRHESPTYKQWTAVELSAENKKQLMIPRGFGHGFVTLTDEVEFLYKADNYYAPEADGGIRWNDPEIGIEWPKVKGEYRGNADAEGYTLEDGTALNLSDKDQKWLGLKDTFKF